MLVSAYDRLTPRSTPFANTMPVIHITTEIAAPVQRCFDLARDIDFHVQSMAGTGERAVAGTTSGLISAGEWVTWEGRHFGVRQRFTAQITAVDLPYHFQDVMTAGAFQSFVHDHRFEETTDGTLMRDEISFRSPYGLVGQLVDVTFMKGYLTRLLTDRCQAIKREAELNR